MKDFSSSNCQLPDRRSPGESFAFLENPARDCLTTAKLKSLKSALNLRHWFWLIHSLLFWLVRRAVLLLSAVGECLCGVE